MRVLFVGDAVVSTGFALCTHAVCDELHARGHEVIVLGINHGGDPDHGYPYPIYPPVSHLERARDGFGVARLPRFTDRFDPDFVVLLNDTWNVGAYLDCLDAAYSGTDKSVPPVVAWVAVDSLNQRHAPDLNRIRAVVPWTEFAKMELVRGGMTNPNVHIIPLGVDHSVYRPADRTESRARIGLDQFGPDAFILGSIGRNQLRKQLLLTIEYFAEWIHSKRVTNAYLYLHCAPTGENAADINSLVDFYGIADHVAVARAHTPGAGASHDFMRAMYNSLDVYVSTSQAEGWGLPTLEAMACGVPCVVPDFAAFGPHGWVGDAAVRVPSPHHVLTAPFGTSLYTIGAIPDKRSFIDELHAMYSSSDHRNTYILRGLRKAGEFSWIATGEAFANLLESMMPQTTDDVGVVADVEGDLEPDLGEHMADSARA